MVDWTNDESRLGELIRNGRRANGLTQADLSQRVEGGISVVSLSRIENGSKNHKPTPRTIANLILALDLRPEDAAAAIDDEELRGEVVAWMNRLGFDEVREHMIQRGAHHVPEDRAADIILISPAGTVCEVQVKASKTAAGAAGRQLSELLGEQGWMVTMPVG